MALGFEFDQEIADRKFPNVLGGVDDWRSPHHYVGYQLPGFFFTVRPLLHHRIVQENRQTHVMAVGCGVFAGLHFLRKHGEIFSIVKNFVARWWRRSGSWSHYFGVRRFYRHFEVISTFGGRIAFAGFESLDVATLHLLAIQFQRAKRYHDTVSAGSRSRRAWRVVLEHSHEFI